MAVKSYIEMLENYSNYSLKNHKHIMPQFAAGPASDNPVEKRAGMMLRGPKREVGRWVREAKSRNSNLNRSIRKAIVNDIQAEISEDISTV